MDETNYFEILPIFFQIYHLKFYNTYHKNLIFYFVLKLIEFCESNWF